MDTVGTVERVAHRRLSITLIVVCQSVQALAYGGIALFLPLIRDDVGMSFAQAGGLAAASNFVYALMQVPSGYLADRFSPRRLFLIGLLGTNTLAFGFAVLHRYEYLLVNQALSGFFRALMFAPGMLLVSSLFAPTRRATAMGLYVAGGFSSNILLNSAGPFLVGPLGWRRLFIIFALLGFLAVAAYLWVSRASAPAATAQQVRLRELGGLLRRPVLWVTGLIQFVRLSVVAGLAFWLPSYLVADKGFDLPTAGLVVALGALATAPANFVGGYLSDRLGRPLLVIGVSLAVLAATLLVLPATVGLVPTLVVVGINSIVVQVYFGPLFSVAIDYLGPRTAGLTSGFGNFCANLGGFVSVWVLGVVKDATGSFRPGLLYLAGLCTVGLLATVGLTRRPPSQDPTNRSVFRENSEN